MLFLSPNQQCQSTKRVKTGRLLFHPAQFYVVRTELDGLQSVGAEVCAKLNKKVNVQNMCTVLSAQFTCNLRAIVIRARIRTMTTIGISSSGLRPSLSINGTWSQSQFGKLGTHTITHTTNYKTMLIAQEEDNH